jgi:hypothetical protein
MMDTNTAFEFAAKISTTVEHLMHLELVLDDCLMGSFPASDPISSFDFRAPPALAL